MRFLTIMLPFLMLTACSSSDPQPLGSHPLTVEEVGQTPPVAEKRAFRCNRKGEYSFYVIFLILLGVLGVLGEKLLF